MARKKRESSVKVQQGSNVNLETITNAYFTTLKSTSMSNSLKIYSVADGLYDACIQHYDYLQTEKDSQKQYEMCMRIDKEVLPILSDSVRYANDLKIAKKILDLHKMFFALSSRRILKNFALYIESGKTKKVWDKTLETVQSVFYYTDLFSVSKKLNLLRVSLMPSMGKSYIANLFVAQTIGNDPQTQILRITYADDLCISTTGQTRGIMESKEYREIFPRYANIPNKSLFKSATKYHLCICDCEDEYNLFAVTREG